MIIYYNKLIKNTPISHQSHLVDYVLGARPVSFYPVKLVYVYCWNSKHATFLMCFCQTKQAGGNLHQHSPRIGSKGCRGINSNTNEIFSHVVGATAPVYLHLARRDTSDAVFQPANGREIRVPARVLIFNLNVLPTFIASRFVHFLRLNETNVLCGSA